MRTKLHVGYNHQYGYNFRVSQLVIRLEDYKTGLHSFRGHFATALEQIGCPEDIASVLAGHKRLPLTYSLYSNHRDKAKLWQYIERIYEAACLRPLVPRIDDAAM